MKTRDEFGLELKSRIRSETSRVWKLPADDVPSLFPPGSSLYGSMIDIVERMNRQNGEQRGAEELASDLYEEERAKAEAEITAAKATIAELREAFRGAANTILREVSAGRACALFELLDRTEPKP
jgi:hypothetical protein